MTTASSDTTQQAIIGPSITVKGDISGKQDILIHGTVEGTISLESNTVTIGNDAHVTADIFGKMIHVQGTVNGNLQATEKVVVHNTGCVTGNITAPKLSLEEGARLKGAIDTSSSVAVSNAQTRSLTGRIESSSSSKANTSNTIAKDLLNPKADTDSTTSLRDN